MTRPYTAERPEERKPHHFTAEEANAFLATWSRVVAGDGSTVAYVPDIVTAETVARLLGVSS